MRKAPGSESSANHSFCHQESPLQAPSLYAGPLLLHSPLWKADLGSGVQAGMVPTVARIYSCRSTGWDRRTHEMPRRGGSAQTHLLCLEQHIGASEPLVVVFGQVVNVPPRKNHRPCPICNSKLPVRGPYLSVGISENRAGIAHPFARPLTGPCSASACPNRAANGRKQTTAPASA